MMIARWTYKDADGKSTAALIRLEEGELRRVLEWLAYTIHSCSDGIDGDPLLFKLGDITNVLDELDLYERVDSRALKDALAQRAGVIYAPSPRLFKFAHLSFQEHLAACHLCGSAANFPRSVVALLAGGDLTRWRNVLTLLPGELDGGKLWTLIQALLPARDAAPPAEPEHPAWYSLYYALHWMQTYRQPDDDDYRQLVQRRCVPWLVRLVETGALTAVERAEMGRLLGALGDTRPGVGLRRDGLPDVPDIDWAEAVLPGSYPVGGDEEAYQSLPAQTVELDYPFWLAKYPVTYAQYEAFVASDGYINPDYWTEAGWDWKGDKTHPERYWNDPRWHIANHPVVGVTWFEAVAFTRWLDALYRKHNLWGDLVGTTHASSGALIDPAASAASHDPASSGERTRHASSLRIRLPTEIEWEIAARGQAGLVYSYGDTFDAAKGNADQTGIGRTSAVGIFPDGASPCGALDMSGNVWEWCLTEHQSGSNDINRTEKRVLRGGSWNYFDAFVRAADRNRLNPVDSYGYLGFRCALS
jgi:formylglycine-generating enzyme required for sulfatase activity